MAHSKYLQNVINLNLSSTSISDKGLGIFLNSKNCIPLEELDISLNQPLVGDDSLVNIAYSQNITKLKKLNMQGTKISSNGIQVLMLEENSKKTQYLEYLDFSAYLNELNKNIDDKALNFMALGYLRLLKELNLRGTNVTSKGIIAYLSSFNSHSLETLRISYNQLIDNDVLVHIADSKRLKKLRKIYVNETKVTQDGITNLEKLKPLIQIIYGTLVTKQQVAQFKFKVD